MSLICISVLVLNGCLAVTIISGVVGGVDSVAKEIKINKLEKEIEKIKKDRDE
jgi:predicted Rossmann fold nucleotide-binding protein DprA/Smf involved in DNA uptake